MTDDRIYWKIPGRVLHMKGIRDATLAQIHADTKTIHQQAETGTPPIHLLLDMSDIGMFPGEDITEEMVALLSYPQFGRIVVAEFPQFDLAIFQAAGAALTQLTGKPIDFVETVADGLALLREHDPTLDA